MPFEKAITYKGDLSEVFICTYSRDKTFERIRQNPRRYVSFFQKVGGLIGFDFSIHSDMNLIKQKSQINDNLSLTYFYGKNNVSIIPNLRCGDEKEEFFKAIPKNCLLSIGTNGFIKEKHMKAEWFCFIEEIIKTLQPKGIIVYGPLDKSIINHFKNTKFYLYEPWMTQRRKRGGQHGN